MTRKPPPLTVTDLARMGGRARAAKLSKAQLHEQATKASRIAQDRRKEMTEAEHAQASEAAREHARKLWAPGGALRVRADRKKKAKARRKT